MYEPRHHRPIATPRFLRRIVLHVSTAVGLVTGSLLLGMIGYVYFEDIETGEVVAFDTSGSGRERFAALARRQREEREALFRRYKIDFIRVRTDQPYLTALIQFFRTRTSRMKH